MSEPLYSVGTWYYGHNRYSPQRGLTVSSFNITLRQLRQAMRELREMGYACHRFRDPNGEHNHSDSEVLVERTDGEHWLRIMRRWKR